MINLEQVKLLEAKVAKTIDFVDRISKENVVLVQRESELQEKLESYQKRIDELEVLIMGFKEEQGRIEDGILAALDRLSQFEDAIEKSMKEKPHSKPAKDAVKSHGHTSHKAAKAEAAEAAAPAATAAKAEPEPVDSSNDCFEIPDDEVVNDILDPLTETMDEEAADGNSPDKGGELDIF